MNSPFIPAPEATPFRNGFNSFSHALQFGLTLGGGGEDSASCPYTITVDRAFEFEDGSSVIIHAVSGMDVVFSIREVTMPPVDGSSPAPTYYVGERYQ